MFSVARAAGVWGRGLLRDRRRAMRGDRDRQAARARGLEAGVSNGPANPHISQVSRCGGWVRAGGWFRTWPARVPAAVGGWAGSTMVSLVAGLVESRSQAAAALRNRA